jgi:hypothetical protein
MRRFMAALMAGPAPDVFIMRRASFTVFSISLAATPAAPTPTVSPPGSAFCRILGDLDTLQRQHTHWPVLAEHCQLFVAIGGLPLRNAQVNGGGANDHALQHWLQTLRRNGTRFINISPVQNDLSAVPDADWLAVNPAAIRRYCWRSARC